MRGSLGGYDIGNDDEENEDVNRDPWGFGVDVFSAPRVKKPNPFKEDEDEDDYDEDDEENEQFEEGETQIESNIDLNTKQQPSRSKPKQKRSKYLFWTDFLQSEMPNRSVVELACSAPPSGYLSSSLVGRCTDLHHSELEAIEDAIRFQLEHADRVDSIQAIWDAYSPVSAHVRRVLLTFAEEAPKASCIFMPAAHPESKVQLPPSVISDPSILAQLESKVHSNDVEDEEETSIRQQRSLLLRGAGAALNLMDAIDCDLEHMAVPMDVSLWTSNVNINESAAKIALALDSLSLPMKLRTAGAASFHQLNKLVSGPHETMVGLSLAPWIPKPQPKNAAHEDSAKHHAMSSRMRKILEASLPPPPPETPIPFSELASVPNGTLEKISHRFQFASGRVQSVDDIGKLVSVLPAAIQKQMWMLGCPSILPVSFPRSVIKDCFTGDVTSTIVRVHNARAGGGNVSTKRWCEDFLGIRARKDWEEISMLTGIEQEDWENVKANILSHDLLGVENDDDNDDDDDVEVE